MYIRKYVQICTARNALSYIEHDVLFWFINHSSFQSLRSSSISKTIFALSMSGESVCHKKYIRICLDGSHVATTQEYGFKICQASIYFKITAIYCHVDKMNLWYLPVTTKKNKKECIRWVYYFLYICFAMGNITKAIDDGMFHIFSPVRTFYPFKV